MFDPASATVQVGTTVTWRNDELITHTITSGRFIEVDETTGLRSSQDPDGTFEATLPGKGKTSSEAAALRATLTSLLSDHVWLAGNR
jgi:plastocyanin